MPASDVKWLARQDMTAPEGAPLRFAGNDHPRRARRRRRRPENAHPLVNLPFELIGIDEPVDAQRPEEMADALADAAAGDLLPQGERRRERPPVRPAQHAAE